jgi:hypothetical protein
MLRGLALLFLVSMFVVVLSRGGAAVVRKDPSSPQSHDKFVAQAATPTPGPIYWYYDNAPTPSHIPARGPRLTAPSLPETSTTPAPEAQDQLHPALTSSARICATSSALVRAGLNRPRFLCSGMTSALRH